MDGGNSTRLSLLLLPDENQPIQITSRVLTSDEKGQVIRLGQQEGSLQSDKSLLTLNFMTKAVSGNHTQPCFINHVGRLSLSRWARPKRMQPGVDTLTISMQLQILVVIS